MAKIREWVGSFNGRTSPVLSYDDNFDPVQLAGSTLLRTIGQVTVEWDLNTAHFPPDPAPPITVGVYQSRNIVSDSGLPTVADLEADWLWWGHLPMSADFGAISSVQSDLVWRGYVSFDVKGQRKIDTSGALCMVRFDGGPMWGAGAGTMRYFSLWWTIRQLWEHDA